MFEINKGKIGNEGIVLILSILFFSSCNYSHPVSKIPGQHRGKCQGGAHRQYINFFEEVYETMDANYYKPVLRKDYEHFIEKFNAKIYRQLKEKGKSVDFIRWRSASFLVEALKEDEDVFSEFYPPKPAVEYAKTALGKRVDLGIEGNFLKEGYKASLIEPRSDAYKKGLRKGDIILEIDGSRVAKLKEREVEELLRPLEGSTVVIKYFDSAKQVRRQIKVVSREYFKQTVFMRPVKAPGVYCLEIRRFNRLTSDDMFRFLKLIRERGNAIGLILDLRDNPGGPPLAAREISSFFLTGGDDFAYFQKKGQPRASLNVPVISREFHYDGQMVILINEKSGSAAELFSGILQRRKRAVLMGANSAGQVMLKSMFHLDDGSMILLVTARGHHPDGSVFSFDGLVPDKYIEKGQANIMDYASLYFYKIHTQR